MLVLEAWGVAILGFYRHSYLIVEHVNWKPFRLVVLQDEADFCGRRAILALILCHLIAARCLHLARHQIIDQSLTPVQVSSQIVTDLDQPVSFVLQLLYLLISVGNFDLELSNLPFTVQVVAAFFCSLLSDRILDLFHDGLHVDLHLLNQLLQRFVFFFHELQLELRMLGRGALEHLCQWSSGPLLIGERLKPVRYIALLHHIVVALDEVHLEAVQAVVQRRTTCLLVVAPYELLQVLRRSCWLFLTSTTRQESFSIELRGFLLLLLILLTLRPLHHEIVRHWGGSTRQIANITALLVLVLHLTTPHLLLQFFLQKFDFKLELFLKLLALCLLFDS